MFKGISMASFVWFKRDRGAYPQIFGIDLEPELNDNESDDGTHELDDLEYELSVKDGKPFLNINCFEFQVYIAIDEEEDDQHYIRFDVADSEKLDYEGYDAIGTRGCWDIFIDTRIPTEIWNTIKSEL